MTAIEPISAQEIPEHKKQSSYPEPFASMMKGRSKRKLGDYFGLENFGVNLTRLSPGAMSALKHQHTKQDEFIYVISGTPTLINGDAEYLMTPGQCFGFRCNNGVAHHIVNNSENEVVYLEVGDRTPGDEVQYPNDDICAVSQENGTWMFLHKDGTPY